MLIVLVCDDNPLHVEQICACATKIVQDEQIREYQMIACYSGEELCQRVSESEEEGCQQIVLMDIELSEEENGICIAHKIQQRNPEIQLIFITGTPEWCFQAGRADPIYFLGKPIDPAEMKFAIQKALKKLEKPKISFHEKGKEIPLRLEDIFYIERIVRKSYLHTKQGIEVISLPLDAMMNILIKKYFVRCHNSFIVNLEYITAMKTNEFELVTGEIVPISRNYFTAVRDSYADYVGEQI